MILNRGRFEGILFISSRIYAKGAEAKLVQNVICTLAREMPRSTALMFILASIVVVSVDKVGLLCNKLRK